MLNAQYHVFILLQDMFNFFYGKHNCINYIKEHSVSQVIIKFVLKKLIKYSFISNCIFI